MDKILELALGGVCAVLVMCTVRVTNFIIDRYIFSICIKKKLFGKALYAMNKTNPLQGESQHYKLHLRQKVFENQTKRQTHTTHL